MVAIPILGTLIDSLTRKISEVLAYVDIGRLVFMQVYRIAGAVFLVAFFYFDADFSREFAMKAGWGDVSMGVLALPVAFLVWKRIAGWPVAIVIWCAIGIGNLILAPLTAVQFGGPNPNAFPISAIPLFFGPALGICTHIITLRATDLSRTK